MDEFKKIDMDVPYALKNEKNGTRILTINAKNTGLCFLQLIVRVGSLDEKDNEVEIAHFLEHLNGSFTSSKYPGAKLVQGRIEKYGGDFNASVGEYITEYHITGSMKFFNEFWSIFSEAFTDFVPDMSMFEKERNSMREELNDELNDQWIKLDEKVAKVLWGNHRASRTVRDRLKVLNKLTIDDIKKFRRKYYIPKLTTIVISADMDLKKSYGYAKTLSNGLPGSSGTIPKSLPALIQKSTKGSVIFVPNKNSESYKLYIIFRTKIKAFSSEDDEANVLASLLSEGMSSVLMSRLRTDEGLIYGVSCDMFSDNVDPALSYFQISTTIHGRNLLKVVNLIFPILETLRTKSANIENLRKLENQLLTLVLDSASIKDPSHFGDQYAVEVPWGKGVKTFHQNAVEIRKCINKKSLRSISREIFKKSNMIIAYSGKKKITGITIK